MESYFDRDGSAQTRKKWSWIVGSGMLLWVALVLMSLCLSIKRVQNLPYDSALNVKLGSLTLLQFQKQPFGDGYILSFELQAGLAVLLVLSLVMTFIVVQCIAHHPKTTKIRSL